MISGLLFASLTCAACGLAERFQRSTVFDSMPEKLEKGVPA
jgi:hypothetical protein